MLIIPIQAQTIGPGFYEFESATGLTYTGTWTTVNSNAAYTARRTTVTSSKVEFVVDGDYLVIYRSMYNVGSSADSTFCIDTDCISYSMNLASPLTMYAYPTGFLLNPDAPSNVSITMTAGRLELDSFMVFDTITNISGSSPSSTPTPEPYYIYGSVSGTSGDVDTRFDMVVTAGDVAVSTALLFLFFSVWAMILIYFVSKRDG